MELSVFPFSANIPGKTHVMAESRISLKHEKMEDEVGIRTVINQFMNS